MTKRFTNEAHVLSGSVRRAIDARGDARGGGVSIPGRTREEPYGFVFGDPGSAATRPGARRGGAASPDPRDWHDAIDPGSMPNFGDQLAEVVKYLPSGTSRQSILGWISGRTGRVPSGGPSTGGGINSGSGLSGLPGNTPGPPDPAGRAGLDGRHPEGFHPVKASVIAPGPGRRPAHWTLQGDDRIEDARIDYDAGERNDPFRGNPLTHPDQHAAWTARHAERKAKFNKEILKGLKEKAAIQRYEQRKADEKAKEEEQEREAEERKKKKDPNRPKASTTPNPFDDGGGPVDPRIRGARWTHEALPNPDDDSGPAGPWSRTALPNPEGGGPVGPWAVTAGRAASRRDVFLPNPDDDGGPVGPSLRFSRNGGVLRG